MGLFPRLMQQELPRAYEMLVWPVSVCSCRLQMHVSTRRWSSQKLVLVSLMPAASSLLLSKLLHQTEAGIPVECTAVAKPGVDLEAVEHLATGTLKANSYKSRPYFP